MSDSAPAPVAPWLRHDMLRAVGPAGLGRHGVLRTGSEGVLPHAVADLQALRRVVGPGGGDRPLFAWMPHDLHVRTIYEIDEVAEAVEERSRAEARGAVRRAWPKACATVLLVVAAIVFWPTDRAAQMLVVLGAIFLFAPLWTRGVEAWAESAADLRGLARDPARWRRRRAERLRYEAWSTAGSSRTGLALVAVCVLVFVLTLVVGRGAAFDALALVKGKVREGEVWRLFTCTLLHANVLHIYFNLMVGLALASMARRLVSESRVLLTFLVGGLAGSLASLGLTGGSSVGASGAILAWGGMLAGLALAHPDVRRTGILGRMLRWVLLLAIIGLAGRGFIDNAAHAGGFVVGLLLGVLFVRGRRPTLPIGGERLGPAFWVLAALGGLGAAGTLLVLLRLAAHG